MSSAGQSDNARIFDPFLTLSIDKNPNRVAGGLKATINNPNISEETKQDAKERLDNFDSQEVGSAPSTKSTRNDSSATGMQDVDDDVEDAGYTQQQLGTCCLPMSYTLSKCQIPRWIQSCLTPRWYQRRGKGEGSQCASFCRGVRRTYQLIVLNQCKCTLPCLNVLPNKAPINLYFIHLLSAIFAW